MAIAYVTTLRTTRMTDIVTALGSGSKMRIYSGTRPATGGTETTVLAEIALVTPTAGTVTSGVLTITQPLVDASANATGTASWARLMTSANAAVADMNVGTSGSDINFDSVGFVAAGNVSITSLTITEGNA